MVADQKEISKGKRERATTEKVKGRETTERGEQATRGKKKHTHKRRGWRG